MSAREAVAVGAAWFCINLILDYPMFAYGPMRMTAAAYYFEIGLDYLAFPVVALTTAFVVERTISSKHAHQFARATPHGIDIHETVRNTQ